MEISAESITGSLDKGRRVKANSYTACCPAHSDKSPSLSITQSADKVLLYCHSGCRQDDVIDALRSRGLWHDKQEQKALTTEEDKWNEAYISAYFQARAMGVPPSTKEEQRYRNAMSAKHYPYTYEELEYANLWCVTYRDNTKKGYTPTPEEDAKFRKYSDLCYREGVAYAQ